MTAQGHIGGVEIATNLGGLDIAARDAFARISDENALLRAALADMQARLAEMEATSERDALTGLPNRAAYMRTLDRVVSQANRYGTPGALLYVDVNGLAAINEAHGQVTGDAALIHVARQLSDLIRTSDFAAYVGGDEFALVLDHLDGDSAIETAERITACIAANPLDVGNRQVAVGVTVGVATILRGDSIEDVARRGELVMHKAKRG